LADLTLGLGGSDHEFAAALMRDDDIRIAIEQERLSRRKHGLSLWYEDPVKLSIDYCLGAEGVSLREVGSVVSSNILPLRIQRSLKDHPVRLYPHHLCHAASAYLMLPQGAKTGVIVYDGFGSVRGLVAGDSQRQYRETFSFFFFGPEGYECLGHTVGEGLIEDDFQTSITNSVGLLYELVTSLLGNHPFDCGKTMGLSAHGSPRYLEAMERFVAYGDDVSDCFSCAIEDPALVATIEGILHAGRNNFEVKADVAASVQALVNKALLNCERFFRGRDIDFLCVSGGCGLNTVANSYLVEHSSLDVPVVIPPYCGDSNVFANAVSHRRSPSVVAPRTLNYPGPAGVTRVKNAGAPCRSTTRVSHSIRRSCRAATSPAPSPRVRSWQSSTAAPR
jgi:carbamoyltransferase